MFWVGDKTGVTCKLHERVLRTLLPVTGKAVKQDKCRSKALWFWELKAEKCWGIHSLSGLPSLELLKARLDEALGNLI